MRKHVENAKAEEVTTEPENEVQQDATLSESQKRVLREIDEPQAGQVEQAGNGPVNVADLQPGRNVDPLLGDKADVLQFLSQLTQAIEGAGVINARYLQGFLEGISERITAVESGYDKLAAAVLQNVEQNRALSIDINKMLDLFAAAQK